jgi:HPt (histidine-containing phosphotransfer) domain-containing protein
MFTRLKSRMTGFLKKAWHGLLQPDTAAHPQMTGLDVPELPILPEDDLRLESLAREFSRELFAQLLLELPDHRSRMAQAHADDNYRRLRDSVHQILGAAAYCEAYELETCLRELRLALKTEDPHTIDVYFIRTMDIIDTTLHASGHH